jgi:tetratricopeptide (TPR) repeat protein
MIRAVERGASGGRFRHLSAWVVACAFAGCGSGVGAAPAAAAPARRSDPAGPDRVDGPVEHRVEPASTRVAENAGKDGGKDAGKERDRRDRNAGKDTPGAEGKGDVKGAASGDLVDTVTTSKSRVELSSWLARTAEAAAAKREWARAIPMYQALVVARGPASPEARKLAQLWTLAGQYEEAVTVLQAFAASSSDAAQLRDAKNEIQRLTKSADPFARSLDLIPVESEARKAFKLGRDSFSRKKWGDALVYFQMGYALAPDLPGFLRELGATYDRLGEKAKKLDFYRRYLFRRPFGKNSDVVRQELARERDALGKLTLGSSLPCEEVWLNRQRVPGKLPKKDLLVAPGSYKGLCFNAHYEIAFFEYTNVESGRASKLSFNWAILVNELKNPYGRISIENPQQPGLMIDLGISNPEVGVVVPSDGRALRMLVKDDLGARQEERFVKLQPGQRQVIKW